MDSNLIILDNQTIPNIPNFGSVQEIVIINNSSELIFKELPCSPPEQELKYIYWGNITGNINLQKDLALALASIKNSISSGIDEFYTILNNRINTLVSDTNARFLSIEQSIDNIEQSGTTKNITATGVTVGADLTVGGYFTLGGHAVNNITVSEEGLAPSDQTLTTSAYVRKEINDRALSSVNEDSAAERITFRKGLTAYSTSTEGAGNGIIEGEESEIIEIPANDVEMSIGELTNVDQSSDTATEGAILVKGSDGIFYPNTTLINNLSNKVYTLDINDTPQNMFTLLNANKFKKFVVIGVNETDGSETFDAIVNYTPISIRVSWYEGFVFNTLLLEKVGDVIAKEILYINLIK